MPLALPDLETQPFALIEKHGQVFVFRGPVHELARIEDIHALARRLDRDVVFALPYRTIRERGFQARGEEPVLALVVEKEEGPWAVEEIQSLLPARPVTLAQPVRPSLSDEAQMGVIKALQEAEIEGGNASQINISRIFAGKLDVGGLPALLDVYRRLLGKRGQYMTVLFHRPDTGQSLVGATPECHLEIAGDKTLMMPIAGTLRKEDRETFETRLEAFLSDPKEINELYQVTDEELKMMGRICPDGGSIEGPYLKEIGNVVHTFYRLVGQRSPNSMESLRRTLHAPTVVGSPMESAAKIITSYEPESRRYYAGEIGTYRYRDRPEGREYGDMDVAILIRCAEVFADGSFRVQAGGGIVRDSDPASEVRENRAKASVVVDVLTGQDRDAPPYLTEELHAKYLPLLMQRNKHLSKFWMDPQGGGAGDLGLRVTIINNEDDFAFMIGHMARRLGCAVNVIDTFSYDLASDDSDVVVIGPGPGDINDARNPRMTALKTSLLALKARGKPLLGICLGHQALATLEGLPVVRQPRSSQGMQRQVRVFGRPARLGFYNSFSPVAPPGRKDDRLHLDLDDEGRIIALCGEKMIGFQFHPESIMSEDGLDLLQEALRTLTCEEAGKTSRVHRL